MIKIFLKIIFLTIVSFNYLMASTDYFNEGLMLYKKEELDKAKFKFEQDIVYNPKNEKSYLYLSKIFNKKDNNELEEKNLNTVILLNPRNEEAIYNLAKLRLKNSDYNRSKILLDKLLIFCKNYCKKSKDLKIEIEKSIKK